MRFKVRVRGATFRLIALAGSPNTACSLLWSYSEGVEMNFRVVKMDLAQSRRDAPRLLPFP